MPDLTTKHPAGATRRALIAGLLLAALGLRLAAGAWWQSRLAGSFGFGDSQSYWELARAVAQGGPYRYGEDVVFRAPGYPLLLAPLFLLSDNPPVMWARALSALWATLAVAGVGGLAAVLFDRRTALWAVAIAAVYPGAVALGAFVLSEAPFSALIVAQLALWALAAKADRAPSAACLALGTGLLGGAATLVRPSWLLFTPFALAAWFAGWTTERRACKHAPYWLMMGLVLAVCPWVARNAVVTGHFVPTTLQVGASLYDGLGPQATGASDMRFVDSKRELERAVDPSSPATLEYRLDRRLRREAIEWAVAHPGEAARLALVKLGRMWNFWPNEAAFSAWPIRLGVVFTYVPLLIFAIIGAQRTSCRGWPYWLCWLPAVYLTLLHVVFVSSVRYREPAMLALIPLAAWVARSLWERGRLPSRVEGAE